MWFVCTVFVSVWVCQGDHINDGRGHDPAYGHKTYLGALWDLYVNRSTRWDDDWHIVWIDTKYIQGKE